MSSGTYVLTRFERLLRVEKVEYTVEIPENIKNKRKYAEGQVLENNYTDCKVVDIPLSEMLEEKVYSLHGTGEKE